MIFVYHYATGVLGAKNYAKNRKLREKKKQICDKRACMLYALKLHFCNKICVNSTTNYKLCLKELHNMRRYFNQATPQTCAINKQTKNRLASQNAFNYFTWSDNRGPRFTACTQNYVCSYTPPFLLC